jgi:hypothetical protein
MFEKPTGTTDTETREGIDTATDDRESESGRSSFAERYVEANTHEA